ncbi:hypothetical protein [Streptomyces sp. GbtcB7]|uniref:hypothetical protein n=1 Tax=Streptomyces sp. GbtcB7 TaxID=2824752 RepID=UPI001C2FC140|nr:hypothetical protein [Streptomyces sp. GbtcB7]
MGGVRPRRPRGDRLLPPRSFDIVGAVLSAVGLVLVVMGILTADNNIWLMIALLVLGALAAAMITLAVFGLGGLAAAVFLPRETGSSTGRTPRTTAPRTSA